MVEFSWPRARGIKLCVEYSLKSLLTSDIMILTWLWFWHGEMFFLTVRQQKIVSLLHLPILTSPTWASITLGIWLKSRNMWLKSVSSIYVLSNMTTWVSCCEWMHYSLSCMLICACYDRPRSFSGSAVEQKKTSEGGTKKRFYHYYSSIIFYCTLFFIYCLD